MVQQGWMLPGAGTSAARGHGGGDVESTGCLWLPTAGHPSPPSDIPAPTASLWVPTNPDSLTRHGVPAPQTPSTGVRCSCITPLNEGYLYPFPDPAAELGEL